jgi:hypothetical protein
MSQEPAVLGYGAARPRAVRKLTMEESEGGVRVLFTAPPNWVYILDIALAVGLGVLKLAGGLVIFHFIG